MYEFLVIVGSFEQRVKFFGSTESEARAKAAEWVGDDGTVIECVGLWAVS